MSAWAADEKGVWRNRRAGAAALIVLLALALSAVQGAHRFLVAPFENDFPGFAARAESLESALELNGFYPLGYPLLLWAISQATGTTYVAAQVVAAGAALVLALASYLLASALLGERNGLPVLALLAANPYYWQSALFLGTDLPWAALQCLSFYGTVQALRRQRWTLLAWAGAAAGLGYLMRYTALIALPVTWLWLAIWRPLPRAAGDNWKGALAFLVAFLLLAAPQLWISWQAKGNPFFTLQAKNVWFGIYGDGDWAGRWREVPSDIGLWEVFRLGPERFLAHWAEGGLRWVLYSIFMIFGLNLDAFRAVSMPWRLALAAMGGLLALGVAVALGRRLSALRLRVGPEAGLLGLFYVSYGLSVAMVFVQPRFLLPALPLLLIMVAWVLASATHVPPFAGNRNVGYLRWLGVGLALFAALNSGLALGHYLRDLQPPVAEVERTLRAAGAQDTDMVLATFPWPYSYHTAYRVEQLPREVQDWPSLRQALRDARASYLLFEEAYGARYWPELAFLSRGRQVPPGLCLLWRGERPAVALYRVLED